MSAALAILLSGLLYRIPRGGPDGRWWRQTLGVAEIHGARVWAIGSGLLLAAAAGLWWAAPAVALILWLAEKPRYMLWVSPPRVLPLTVRGLLFLNPLMGAIYALCYRWRDRLPVCGVVLDGWTAWSELACGLAIAATWLLLLTWVATLLA